MECKKFLVDVIERIYSGSMVKFELESIMTAWCKSGLWGETGMSPVSTTV